MEAEAVIVRLLLIYAAIGAVVKILWNIFDRHASPEIPEDTKRSQSKPGRPKS